MKARFAGLGRTAGVLVVALVVAVAAIGAGTASGASAADKILSGSIAGTTGAYGSTGVAMVNGAKLAVADLNARGGVLGKKFSLQSYNDQASATLSSQLFQRLVSAGAVAIVGSGDTGPATSAMAQRLKVPNLGAVDDAGLTIYPDGPTKPPFEWVWSWGLNTFAWGEIVGQYARSHCKALAVLHDPSTYGRGGEAGVKLGYEKGKKLVLDETINEDWSTGATVSLTNEINKIKGTGADCVVVWLTPQDTARFAQSVKSTGVKLKVLGNDEINADNTFASLAGNAADGAVGAMLKTDLHPNAAVKSFRARYKKRFHIASTPFAVANYDAIMMLGALIKKTGSTDPEKLKDALNSVKNFKGLQGTVSFNEQNHATITTKQLALVQYDAKSKTWKAVK